MVLQAGPKPRSCWQAEPDVQLMLRVQRGEAGAFADLVHAWWPRVFALFMRRLGNRQDAEDLAQDVFLRLYRHRLRYRPQARFSTWLYHIARNVARNAIRRRRRRPSTPLSAIGNGDESPDAGFLPRVQEAPGRALERAEASRVVRQALTALADRQRAALELQFRDRSYVEIARLLHMTPKAAKSLLYRARIHLRHLLGPYMTVDA